MCHSFTLASLIYIARKVRDAKIRNAKIQRQKYKITTQNFRGPMSMCHSLHAAVSHFYRTKPPYLTSKYQKRGDKRWREVGEEVAKVRKGGGKGDKGGERRWQRWQEVGEEVAGPSECPQNIVSNQSDRKFKLWPKVANHKLQWVLLSLSTFNLLRQQYFLYLPFVELCQQCAADKLSVALFPGRQLECSC